MATPFEKLTNTEIKMIENYIEDYVADSDSESCQGPFAGVENILAPWNKAKINLFKLFGEELILSKEFSFEMTREELYRQITNLLYNNSFIQKVREAYYNGAFAKTWLDINGNWQVKEVVSCLVNSADTFIDNKFPFWPDNYKKITLKVGKEGTNSIDLFPSTKIMKVLSKVADMLGIEGFEEFRIAHSQILNQKYLKGNFSISIHPLDYMTMSDNDCGWESCMSWRNFGGYRQGTVEMMNSSKVIVAYMNSKTPYLMRGGEWTNKKWRCLFVVDENLICKVKSYPYQNDEFEIEVIKWIRELAQTNLGIEYDENIITWNGEDSIDYNDNDYDPDFATSHMYNDFGTCTHYITFIKGFESDNRYLNIDYSGSPECMWCGALYSLEYDDDLSCNDCLSKHYCCECGERIYSDQVCYDDFNNEYCPYCFENHTVVDPSTGNRVHKSGCYPVYIIPSNKNFIEKYKDAIANGTLGLGGIIERLHAYSRDDIIAYIYDFDTIENLIGTKDKLYQFEWNPEVYWWGDRRTYYIFIDDIIDPEVKEAYSFEWGLKAKVTKRFEKDFDFTVRRNIRPGFEHLLPDYENQSK